MEQPAISSRIICTKLIDWQSLQFIQDDNFKQWISGADMKLLGSIAKYQFVDPFKVWENEGILYCLDGKHRFLDLWAAIDAGIEVPRELPATFISCADMKEAAELVLVYSSFYAKVTAEGLFSFIGKYEIDFEACKETFDLPGLDLNILNDRFLPQPDELIGLTKNKPITLNITFKSKEQIDLVETKIKDLLTEHCPGAYYSVSAGEL